MPSWPFIATLVSVGLAASFISGLLGIGGAAFIVPMLIYVPELLGTGSLDIKQATGMSIVLVFVSALSSSFAHRAGSTACPLAGRLLAPATAAGALIGGLASGRVSAQLLTALFASLALIAGAAMFLPRPKGGDEAKPGQVVTFNITTGLAVALAVGLFAGLVGAGGAFMLVPLMIYVLGIPTRVTIASAPVVVLVSAVAGLLGKVLAGQIPWVLALILVSGAIPGAQVGAWLSHKVGAAQLRWVLGAMTAGLAAKMWFDLLA